MRIKFFWMLLFVFLNIGYAHADMLKCRINATVWNYFESKNTKESKKCITKPELVVASTGEKIRNRYKSPAKPKAKLVAAKDVVPMSSCSGTGGTIRVNGKIFHLDPNFLCKKYGLDKTNRGEIYATNIGRTYKVDDKYRQKISAEVARVAKKYNMDPAFIHAIISAESAYNPNAISRSGAQGLMQLMPFTAKRFGVTNSYNPIQNIEAGTRYLRLLYDEFGSLSLAAAGYNAGEGAVRKYNNQIPPYKETINYVPKVLAFYNKYKSDRSLISAK